ncbi:2-C-methyl-D-erythritol 4-phosphate cytidylyltransferase [Parapedobacter sp. 10938]|uniref:2-C-methyl-D-erythritol 4-phosphate cytidylyltransferase n=1 Tax=Parapedobacter flavus TaxID=3110225 RepID=UPI002DBBC8D6|nr:2-C-methyl-D-erythritol 4-phosphate cytidylyltransferase [Parapedobacter sp. 10938]MEC3881708.1 2-C-methyl-D-erythritol 4-phosphate cytidylyltransferase [Parapedobacter sp. 10938]
MNYAIIVAGGTGSRMGADIPKQFLLLDGLPVMMHAMLAFHRSGSSPQIIVVLHPSLRDDWSALCENYRFTVPHTVVNGGKSRFESVKNGLSEIKSTGADLTHSIIAVHDAARPLVSTTLIDKTYQQAARTGAAALARPSTDSVRITSENGLKNNALPRSYVYLMQTPQSFNGAILCDAYEQDEDHSFTDDASIVEKKGYPITLVDGDTHNIKITFPEDLHIAEILLGKST